MFKRFGGNPFDEQTTMAVEDDVRKDVSRKETAPVTPYTRSGERKNLSKESQAQEFHLEDEWPEKIAPMQTGAGFGALESDQPETVLGDGVVFKGELRFKRFLRIDGQFEGELQSEGKLVVGPRGLVRSNITMREVIIEGYVEGNITVSERIELRGMAKVHGDITASSISVDDGVTLVGRINVNPERESDARARDLPHETEKA